MKKLLCLLMTAVLFLSTVAVTFHAADVDRPIEGAAIEVADEGADVDVAQTGNPYPTQQDTEYISPGVYGDGYYEVPCTWFAWQQAYDRKGISLPDWGHAVNWWQGAKNDGYATGSTPQPDSIAVWSGDTFGHVAYVTSVSGGNTFTINESGRTDLDHTNSHGIAYGYTLTNAVGGSRPHDTGKALLGFIYLNSGGGKYGIDYGNDFYALITTPKTNVVVGQDIASGYNAELVTNSISEYCVFQFTKVNNNNGYMIRSVANNRYLEVYYGADANETNVDFRGYSYDPAQIWYMQSKGEWVSITPGCSNRVLDAYGSRVDIGTNLQLYDWNGTNGQKYNIWKLKDTEKAGLNYGDDFYAMINNGSLKKPIGRADNGNIVLMTESTNNYDRTIWHFTKLNGLNAYRISTLTGDLYIDVEGAQNTDGANVQCYKYHDHPAQEWYIQLRKGSLALVPGCSSRFLDITGAGTADGTNVELWEYHGNNDAQKFSLDILDENDIVNYSISTDKSQYNMNDTATVTIGGDLPYVYNYKFHIMKPDGTKIVIDNKCQNTLSYRPDAEGTFTVFAEVKNPIYTDTGSAVNKAITFTVGNTSKYILADADGDGKVTSIDVTCVQRYCTKMNLDIDESILMHADVNSNGTLDLLDSTFIQRYLSHITTPYAIGETK